MDSYALIQEQGNLFKSVSELRNLKENLDSRIKELHDEEMLYLKEIPEYKKRSEEDKNNYLKLEAQSISLKRDRTDRTERLNI